MILGATTYGFAKKIRNEGYTLPQVLGELKKLGCECAELSPVSFDLLRDEGLADEIIAASKEYDLPISSYTIGGNFLTEDEESFQKELTRLMKQQEICARLGAKRMRHDLCQGRRGEDNSILRYREAFPTLVRAGKELAKNAESLGIVTSVENHGYFNNGSDRVIELIEAVGHPNFRLTLDIGNFMCVDENSVVAVEKCIPYASMVHLKDFYLRRFDADTAAFYQSKEVGNWFPTRRGDILRGAVVGQGDIDMPRVLSVIKKSGYNGFMSIEFEGTEECAAGISMGLHTARHLWDTL